MLAVKADMTPPISVADHATVIEQTSTKKWARLHEWYYPQVKERMFMTNHHKYERYYTWYEICLSNNKKIRPSSVVATHSVLHVSALVKAKVVRTAEQRHHLGCLGWKVTVDRTLEKSQVKAFICRDDEVDKCPMNRPY
jgi:hypothetical protein